MPMPHRPRRSSASSMHLGVIVGLAMRNLRRHLRRTALTSSAMIVGGALLIFTFSLGDGTHETWIDSGVRMGTGHITIESPEFQLSRKIDDRVSGRDLPLVRADGMAHAMNAEAVDRQQRPPRLAVQDRERKWPLQLQ